MPHWEWGFSHGKFRLLSLWKASCDRVVLPNLWVYAGYFSVSIIHQTLTWTTGSVMCAQILTHTIAQGVYGCHERVGTENWLWEKKKPGCARELDLCQWHAGLTLYQLSYIPTRTLCLANIYIYLLASNMTLILHYFQLYHGMLKTCIFLLYWCAVSPLFRTVP